MNESGDSGSGQVGMLSPDGQWRWTGAQWAPAEQAEAAKKRRPIGLIVGAVVALVVIVIGLALFGNQQRDNSVQDENNRMLACQYDATTGAWIPPAQRSADCR